MLETSLRMLYFASSQLSFARSPVLAQVELVGSEGSGEQFEHGQGYATGIHLLENLADGLAGSLLAELDHRQLILLESAARLADGIRATAP